MGQTSTLERSRYGDTSWAAKYLDLSKRYLEVCRLVGDGPAFIKHGRAVRYAIEDLDSWANSRKRLSTSEAA